MKFDVSNNSITVFGESVKEIEILYEDLLRNDKNIKKTTPEKTPLIAFHLEDGGKWEFETKMIIE